jgi:hypothetical protein
MLLVMLFNIFLIASCGYALWRGGAPERICAVLYIVATLLTLLVAPHWQWHFQGVDWGVFTVDLALLAALVLLALHANRFWPMWVCATCGLGLLGHISVIVAPTISPLFYATVSMGSSWPAILLLAIGTWRHSQRVAAGRTDPAWTDFSRLNQPLPARA